jgi:hypothetical protein
MTTFIRIFAVAPRLFLKNDRDLEGQRRELAVTGPVPIPRRLDDRCDANDLISTLLFELYP